MYEEGEHRDTYATRGSTTPFLFKEGADLIQREVFRRVLSTLNTYLISIVIIYFEIHIENTIIYQINNRKVIF